MESSEDGTLHTRGSCEHFYAQEKAQITAEHEVAATVRRFSNALSKRKHNTWSVNFDGLPLLIPENWSTKIYRSFISLKISYPMVVLALAIKSKNFSDIN